MMLHEAIGNASLKEGYGMCKCGQVFPLVNTLRSVNYGFGTAGSISLAEHIERANRR